MVLRLFRLKKTLQPAPAPGSPSAPADSPVTGGPAPEPPVVHKPKAAGKAKPKKAKAAAKPKAKKPTKAKGGKKKR